QIIRPTGRLSMSQETTLNHYPFYKLPAYAATDPKYPSRWESSSQVFGQWRSWESLLQYSWAPRYYREPEVLYTGYGRVGWQMKERKIFSLIFAVSSLQRNLASPQVWRLGVEYTNDFY